MRRNRIAPLINYRSLNGEKQRNGDGLEIKMPGNLIHRALCRLCAARALTITPQSGKSPRPLFRCTEKAGEVQITVSINGGFIHLRHVGRYSSGVGSLPISAATAASSAKPGRRSRQYPDGSGSYG